MKQQLSASVNKHFNTLPQRKERSLHGMNLGGVSGVENAACFLFVQSEHAGKFGFGDVLFMHGQIESSFHCCGDGQGDKVFPTFRRGWKRNIQFIVDSHFHGCFQSTSGFFESMRKRVALSDGFRQVAAGHNKTPILLIRCQVNRINKTSDDSLLRNVVVIQTQLFMHGVKCTGLQFILQIAYHRTSVTIFQYAMRALTFVRVPRIKNIPVPGKFSD